MLAIEVMYLLLMPVDMPPILASPRGPTVAPLFLVIVLFISPVFFRLLLNR